MSEAQYRYLVWVDDNYHFMDDDERYRQGEFTSCAEAIAACKSIVDEFVTQYHRPGIASAELWEGYVGFGEDPWIQSLDPACHFSAWDYARQRCDEMCQNVEA